MNMNGCCVQQHWGESAASPRAGDQNKRLVSCETSAGRRRTGKRSRRRCVVFDFGGPSWEWRWTWTWTGIGLKRRNKCCVGLTRVDSSQQNEKKRESATKRCSIESEPFSLTGREETRPQATDRNTIRWLKLYFLIVGSGATIPSNVKDERLFSGSSCHTTKFSLRCQRKTWIQSQIGWGAVHFYLVLRGHSWSPEDESSTDACWSYWVLQSASSPSQRSWSLNLRSEVKVICFNRVGFEYKKRNKHRCWLLIVNEWRQFPEIGLWRFGESFFFANSTKTKAEFLNLTTIEEYLTIFKSVVICQRITGEHIKVAESTWTTGYIRSSTRPGRFMRVPCWLVCLYSLRIRMNTECVDLRGASDRAHWLYSRRSTEHTFFSHSW